MNKSVAIGAMFVLMLAAAAFANHAVGGDVDIQFLDASQTQAAAAQVNEGDATAGNLGSAAAIDQSQVPADGTWWGW
ncbi:MAG TPA: hypothetical protein VK869_02725 [Rubrobacteraceae bacterium]|nr:hypothetical protein [Rubrobacteraceae bacterium]